MKKQLLDVLHSITDFLEVRLAAGRQPALQAISLTAQRQPDQRNVRRQ